MHSCQIELKGKKPENPAYPAELNTLGDHLRKVRLDRGLSQPEVAKILNTSETIVTAWELNRNQPTAKFAKSIIEFLGYIPFPEKEFLIRRLFLARLATGKTQREVAKDIGADESNLRLIELGRRKPGKELIQKILGFIEGAFARYSE